MTGLVPKAKEPPVFETADEVDLSNLEFWAAPSAEREAAFRRRLDSSG